MKLAEINAETLRKAVAIYLDLAYGDREDSADRVPDLEAARRNEAGVLSIFHRECAEEIEGHPCVRYSLRLGNRNYPFMKLLLQEHLIEGEFFFAVDTHDEMDIKPDFPDFEAWQAVRNFNLALKRKIEAQFGAEGLDTAGRLREVVAARAPGPDAANHEIGARGTVLVVDDEEEIADAVEELLTRQGYRVVKVHDGRSALEAVASVQPDLLLLDYELPEIDGLEVIHRLRGDEGTRHTQVLLATAGRISMADIEKADGFLAKPFEERLLYDMVERLMKASKEAP